MYGMTNLKHKQHYDYHKAYAPNPHRQKFRQLIKSSNCQTWKTLDNLFKSLQKQNQQWYRELFDMITSGLRDVSSFMMLMYLYYLKISIKNIKIYSASWKFVYLRCLEQSQMDIFGTWISSDPSSELSQESLSIVIATFPTFVSNQLFSLSEVQLNAIILWISCTCTNSDKNYEMTFNLAKFLKENKVDLRQDYIDKNFLIIQKMIQMCQNPDMLKYSSNVFLLLYPFQLSEKDMSYFCHVYSDYLLQITSQHLCNFFQCICKGAMEKQILFLIGKIGLLYKNQEEFYKLRTIYQTFIMPFLCARAKSCCKVESQVYECCEFYILGFLKHCDIGKSGFECLTKNLRKVENQKVQNKWIELCLIICEQYPQYRELLSKSLNQQTQSLPSVKSLFNELVTNSDLIWNVTNRNGRKHKTYVKHASKEKGIINESNECYIISVIQALHKGTHLQHFLKSNLQLKNKCSIIEELKMLFDQISKRQDKIFVKYLKKQGPKKFQESVNQEDAYEYLVSLIDSVQICLKQNPIALQAFKDIYEVKSVVVISCPNCKLVEEVNETSYAITVSNKQLLCQESKEVLPDYICPECKQQKSQLYRKINPKSKILIVHINRFTMLKNGQIKKQLFTQTILRKFLQYSLVGMICHKGKNMELGHYLYYHRLNLKKWALFNDSVVEQFDLQHEDEEFEREWKSEVTPFLLFYQESI